MTSLSSTYLIPAILLNPILILHGFNTFCSHFISTALPASTSNLQWLENLGPAAAPGPYFDVHSNDQLCWGYTALMVLVQILAYGKVNDTRVRKKSARAAAKAERERKAASESCISSTMNGHVPESDNHEDITLPAYTKNTMNRWSSAVHDKCAGSQRNEDTKYVDDSTTEPSSEEEIIV
jgi:hypothetical protein